MRLLPIPYRIFMLYVGVSDVFVIGDVSRVVSTAVFINVVVILLTGVFILLLVAAVCIEKETLWYLVFKKLLLLRTYERISTKCIIEHLQ